MIISFYATPQTCSKSLEVSHQSVNPSDQWSYHPKMTAFPWGKENDTGLHLKWEIKIRQKKSSSPFLARVLVQHNLRHQSATLAAESLQASGLWVVLASFQTLPDSNRKCQARRLHVICSHLTGLFILVLPNWIKYEMCWITAGKP